MKIMVFDDDNVDIYVCIDLMFNSAVDDSSKIPLLFPLLFLLFNVPFKFEDKQRTNQFHQSKQNNLLTLILLR